MALALATGNEEQTVQAVLNFINNDEVDSLIEEDWERAKKKGSASVTALQEEVRMFMALAAEYYETPPKGASLAERSNYLAVRDRENLKTLFQRRIKKVKHVSRLGFSGHELETSVVATPTNFEQVCWLAIGLVLDRTWGIYDRVTFCVEEACEKLILQKSNHRRPIARCNACRVEHRKADIKKARMINYNEKQAEKYRNDPAKREHYQSEIKRLREA